MSLRTHSPNQEFRHLKIDTALVPPLGVMRNSENGDAFHRADGGITMLICHSSTCCAAGRLKSWFAGPVAEELVTPMKSNPQSVRLLWLPGPPARTAGPEDSGCQEWARSRQRYKFDECPVPLALTGIDPPLLTGIDPAVISSMDVDAA